MSSAPLLVTGAAGFIGARYVESCNARGTPVVSVDLAAHFEERRELGGVDFGRIVDRRELFERLADGDVAPAAIVHLGACSSTTETRVDYLNEVNVAYSQRLWEYATARRIPMVYASSAATYGDGAQGFEDDEARMPKLQPLNPYGQSKLDFDLWVLEQERLGRTPPAWAGFKFFNVYGYGERHKGSQASVVVHAFDQIRADGRLRLFRSHRDGIADGQQSRDFVYVGDVVDVLHFALAAPIPRGIFNLGTGRARSFLDLARAVFAALGREEAIDWIPTPEAIRDKYQYFTEASMDRLRAEGWQEPFTELEEGVRRTVQRLREAAH
ncbi:MAG: ADP-glyceromanno-heptose 6-epimerase [Myxococcales bacterium]|nr:ADP-glyceromanno-heptose 6-epimerase [Myxococcales bacterium]